MITTPVNEQIPIRADEHGRLRVGNTRVLLDLVIYAYWRGETPETITASYPTLSLDDVYLALGYYLRHRQDIDTYLHQQEDEANAFRTAYEVEHPPTLTREVLMARLDKKRQSEEA